MTDEKKAPDWINCPICGEPDMRCELHGGETLIFCVNHACRSNDETGYDKRLTQAIKERDEAIELRDGLVRTNEQFTLSLQTAGKEIERLNRDWETERRAGDAIMRSLTAANETIERLTGELDKLKDPNAVHVNLLRGSIARPSWDQILHVYTDDAAEIQRLQNEVRRLGEKSGVPTSNPSAVAEKKAGGR